MMDRTFFRQVIHECLLENGFKKKRTSYYKMSEEIVTVVGFQKSSYSDTYYINYGIAIKELLDDPTGYVKDYKCNIRGRFSFKQPDGTSLAQFDLDDNNEQNLRNGIIQGLYEYNPTHLHTIDDLEDLLNKIPDLLYATDVDAKKFLGIPVE